MDGGSLVILGLKMKVTVNNNSTDLWKANRENNNQMLLDKPCRIFNLKSIFSSL